VVALQPIDDMRYCCNGLSVGDDGSYVVNWDELTISECVKLSDIEMSDNFVELYKEEDKERRKQLVLKFTNEQINEEFPNIYREAISVITNVPREVINELDTDSLSLFYHKYCRSIHLACKFISPDSFNKVDSFFVKDVKYLFPKDRDMFGESVGMYDETALTFCESLNTTKMGVGGIPIMMSILCRRKGEDYNQEESISRVPMFSELPMTLGWNMIFKFNDTIKYIEDHYHWIFGSGSMESKIKSAYAKSKLDNIGSMSFIYEVVGETNETLKDVSNMPMYDFLHLLSYLRSKDKLIKYAN